MVRITLLVKVHSCLNMCVQLKLGYLKEHDLCVSFVQYLSSVALGSSH